MDRKNLFPIGRYPPSNALAAAIKELPQPGPEVPPQTVTVNAGPVFGCYSVTFVVRLNAERETLALFWGIAESERIA